MAAALTFFLAVGLIASLPFIFYVAASWAVKAARSHGAGRWLKVTPERAGDMVADLLAIGAVIVAVLAFVFRVI
jgi:hypothetical protein